MIQLGLKNLKNTENTVPLFNEQNNSNADFTKGFIASDQGVYAEDYASITGWDKNTLPSLFFKAKNGVIYFYPTDADRKADTNALAYVALGTNIVSENFLPEIDQYTITVKAKQYFVERISFDYIIYLYLKTLPAYPFTATLNIYTTTGIIPDYTATVSDLDLRNGITLPDVPIPNAPMQINLLIELIPLTGTIVLPLSDIPDNLTVLNDGNYATSECAIFQILGR